MHRSSGNPFRGLFAVAALIGWVGAGPAAAQTPALISATSPGVTIGPAHPTVIVPVTISRDGTTPVLGFSVRVQLSSEFSALTTTGANSDVALGNFLTDNGRGTNLEVVDNGGGSYTIDGVTLGSDCGPTEQTGTLFTLRLSSTAASGTGTVTIQSVTMRDCSNQPISASAGSGASVDIDNSPPSVNVTAPNGGETWTYGSSHPITWTASDNVSVTAIDLAYSTDGGSTFPYTIAAGLSNSGSYSWTIPVTPSTNVRVRATAHDANGNSASDASDADFTIACPTLTLTEAHVNVACFGNSTGSIDLTVSGGAAPYSFAWNDGPTSEDRSGLAAGTYSVTVTDANGCSASTSVTITQPGAALAASSSAGTIACDGGTTTVTVSATGGTPPYSGTGTFTAGAGTHNYAVTDANGCTATTSVTITEPSPLVASAAQGAAISCFGGTTTVTVSATGGTPPYGGTGTFTVGAGTHNYTVTDANGCTATTSVTVTEPSQLVASSAAGTIACNGGTTTVTVSATGGTPPYSGTGTFTVGAGTHNYTVTDANGCTATTSVTITEPTALVASSVAGTIACNGGTTTVTVSATGGTPPYSGTGTFTVSAGPYSYTVTDAHGCTATTTGTITQPSAIVLSETHTGTCVGSPDGTITLTVSGGTGPYTFLWSNGATTQDLTGLAAGSDSVTVTDANHCTATLSVVIAVRAYTITATAGANGAIAPSGSVSVDCGTHQAFTITPNAGYHVGTLTVDAVSQPVVPGVMTYTFTAVSTSHTIDAQFVVNPPVPPITAMQVSQVTSGNDADGTIQLKVHWGETIPATSTVEVYRARFGHYPVYDNLGGTDPLPPATPPAPGGAWEQTAVTASDQTDEVSNGASGYAGRDVWYYVAFVKDEYGTYSPASSMSVGRPNYLLGDVTDGTTPGLGRGDNKVDGDDLSALGYSYGLTGAAMASVAYLDVGPTTDFSVIGRPLTDNAIDFEDLVIFAINYGVGVPAPPRPVARNARAHAARAAAVADRLSVDAPQSVEAGQEFTVRLLLEGTGKVQALSTTLNWNQAVVEPVGVAAGEWLTELGGVAFSPRAGVADVALLGPGGFNGSGVIAEMKFKALAAGDPLVAVGTLKARDEANHDVPLAGSVTGATGALPTMTMLSPAFPNPFQNSTTIGFSLARGGQVAVSIYGVDGRLVRTLANGPREAGVYRLEWNGRDDQGNALSSGIYFVQMTTLQGRSTKKISFVR